MKRWLISLYCYTCLFFISLNIYTKYKQRNFKFCLFCRHLYYSSDFIIIMENNFLSRGGQVKKWLTPVVKYSRQANDGGRSSILFKVSLYIFSMLVNDSQESLSNEHEQTQRCKSFKLTTNGTLSTSFYFYLQPNIPY